MSKRITFLLDNLHVGGAEKHSVDLAKALDGRGFVSSFVVYGGKVSLNMVNKAMLERTTILRATRLISPRYWFATSRALASTRPDVIVAVNQTSLIVAVIAKMIGLLSAPILFILHADVSHIISERDRILVPFFVWCARAANFTVFVSERQQNAWKKLGFCPVPSSVIHNGVNLGIYGARVTDEQRAAAKRELGIPSQSVVFGLLARFRPEKNHISLVLALEQLRREVPTARLLFVGSGPTESDVVALVQNLGLADHVTFAGETGTLGPLIRAMDVGVLCSSAETFSLAALEIMAGGVPMIMTDVGGAAEMVVQGENGVLYDPAKDNELSRLMSMLSDFETRTRMGQAAWLQIRSKFDYEKMVASYIELLNALINGRHRMGGAKFLFPGSPS